MSEAALEFEIEPVETPAETSGGGLEPRVRSLVVLAETFRKITTREQYEAAAELGKDVKRVRNEIAETFDGAISLAYQAHKATLAAKNKHDKPLEQVEKILKGGMGGFIAEEKRKEREAAEAAQREAEKLAATTDGPVILPVATMSVPVKVAGISHSELWSFEVKDLKALAKAVAEGQLPPEAILPNMTYLNGRARAEKDSLRIPGGEAISKPSTSFSA